MNKKTLVRAIGGYFLAWIFLLFLGFFIVFEESLFYTWRRRDSQTKPELAAFSLPAPLYIDLSQERSSYLRSTIVTADARPVMLKKYLEYYRSPLSLYADLIFSVSQRLGLDYRLLVAIAQQESNLCKKIPQDSYNCWGWGIHSQGTMGFSSYPEAILVVAEGLKKDYFDKGLATPEAIMEKYTPSSKGSWAIGVRQFMEEIETGPR